MAGLSGGRELLPKIIDEIVDTVVAEYPDRGDVRLAMYEQIGENLLAMARCLRGNEEPVILTQEDGEINESAN